MDRRFALWRWWLGVVAVAALAFGLSLAALPDAMARLFGGLYLSEPGAIAAFGADAAAYVKFVTAVMGAVMAGWAAALLLVVVFMFRPGRPDAWWLVAISVLVWFVPDTAYSLYSGFWQNAVFNVFALAVFVVPLAATYAAMRKNRSAGPASGT